MGVAIGLTDFSLSSCDRDILPHTLERNHCDMEPEYWFGVIFWGLFWGLVVMKIGQKKGESGLEVIGGFLIGFLLGPIGAILAFLSKGNRISCPFCKSLIDPAASVCSHCQRDIPGKQQAA
jgi:hypothetical protein